MALRSLRTLTLVFLLVFTAVTTATALVTYNTTLATIDRLVRNRLADISSAIAPQEQVPPTGELKSRISATLRTRDNGDLGFVLTKGNAVLLSNVTLHRTLPDGFARVDVRDRISGLTYGWALTRDLGSGRRMTVIAETEPFDNYHGERKRIYLIGFGSIAAVAIAAMLVFGATISRRILEMRRTVNAIIAGDLSRRVPTDGSGSEFDLQAEAFNRMLDRIGELMDEIRNLSSGVAHELRTPLARLRNELSLLATAPGPEETHAKIGNALADADRLLAMFSAMLRMADVESGNRREQFAMLDLAKVAAESVEALEPVAEEHDQILALGASRAVPIFGDAQLLAQLIINLIENAIRHTGPGTRIDVLLGTRDNRAWLQVIDDGPGIPENERTQALARFGRLHHSGAPGYGMGLSLAQSIARLHGGSLRLGDASPGLCVTVDLPLAP